MNNFYMYHLFSAPMLVFGWTIFPYNPHPFAHASTCLLHFLNNEHHNRSTSPDCAIANREKQRTLNMSLWCSILNNNTGNLGLFSCILLSCKKPFFHFTSSQSSWHISRRRKICLYVADLRGASLQQTFILFRSTFSSPIPISWSQIILNFF